MCKLFCTAEYQFTRNTFGSTGTGDINSQAQARVYVISFMTVCVRKLALINADRLKNTTILFICGMGNYYCNL